MHFVQIPPPMAYSTLPRGGHWPPYGGTIAGVRPLPQPYPAIPLQHLRTLPRGYSASPRITQDDHRVVQQQQQQQQQAYAINGDAGNSPGPASDEDAAASTPETPLMIARDKRESTV